MAEKKKAGLEFDAKRTGEQILKFMKSSFDASFDNVDKVQDLNEKLLNEMIKKGQTAEEESKRAVKDFLANAKQERAKYRKSMENGFKKAQEALQGK